MCVDAVGAGVVSEGLAELLRAVVAGPLLRRAGVGVAVRSGFRPLLEGGWLKGHTHGTVDMGSLLCMIQLIFVGKVFSLATRWRLF